MGGSVFDGFAEEEKPLKSLIFAGEAGPDLLFQRAYETHWQLNKENIVIVGLVEAEKKNISLILDKGDGRKHIEYFVEKNKPDIIFFDTFAYFHNKNENKFDDMKPLIRFLSILAEKYNMVVVLMHHTRKSPSKSKKKPVTLDDAIGSSVLIRLISVIIAIEAYSAGDTDEDYLSVKAQSINEAEKRAEAKTRVVNILKTCFQDFNPFIFTILKEDDKTRVVVDLTPSFDEKAKIEIQTLLLEYVREAYGAEQCFKSSELPTEFAVADKLITISHRCIQRLLTVMVNQGKLEKKGFARGMFYQLLPVIARDNGKSRQDFRN